MGLKIFQAEVEGIATQLCPYCFDYIPNHNINELTQIIASTKAVPAP
jgi:hypothetical protein